MSVVYYAFILRIIDQHCIQSQLLPKVLFKTWNKIKHLLHPISKFKWNSLVLKNITVFHNWFLKTILLFKRIWKIHSKTFWHAESYKHTSLSTQTGRSIETAFTFTIIGSTYSSVNDISNSSSNTLETKGAKTTFSDIDENGASVPNFV